MYVNNYHSKICNRTFVEEIFKCRLHSNRRQSTGAGIIPVSYTHLDVYKRQDTMTLKGSYDRKQISI